MTAHGFLSKMGIVVDRSTMEVSLSKEFFDKHAGRVVYDESSARLTTGAVVKSIVVEEDGPDKTELGPEELDFVLGSKVETRGGGSARRLRINFQSIYLLRINL